jgi:tetratricopeptide (TPR) repeat protein
MTSELRRIERFQLEDEAASGAMGTIFRARDTETGERVAIKVIRGFTKEELARFAREGRMLSRIKHQGVVRHIEHGLTESGDAYLVMEWLDGEDLRTRLARARMSVDESVALGRRVAEGLAAIHAHGVVHRDVKPANLFLVDRQVERTKIIDLGLARPGEASMGVTRTGMVIGTPAYMAPEQARGLREVDARADLFSLGCVLFQCLTGRPPFEGTHMVAVLTKVLLEQAPRLGTLRADVPPALEDLVAWLLHKDPARRPESAETVARALDSVARRERGTQPPPEDRRVSGLTTGEQRMVAVLLIGGSDAPSGVRRTDELPLHLPLAADDDLQATAMEHGGQLEQLLDGTRVVTLASSAVATDQAARAAHCALALRAIRPGRPMALSTGRGEIAGHVPVGEAIERAARLLARSARSAPPPIAVDDVTAALLDPRFEVAESDDGLDLVGRRDLELGARTLLGRSTSMVGREWEQASIEALFRECVDEPLARAVVITAPAGMGKSRLGHEVARALQREYPDAAIWVGRGDPLRAGSTLGLLGHALRRVAGIQEDEPLEAQRRRVADRVAQHVPVAQAARVAEFLGEVIGVPFPDEGRVELRAARRDAMLMSEQTRKAWGDFLAAEAAAHPVVLVLEGLQWGDLSTVRFVDAALADLPRLPWMVLALGRPEVHDLFPGLWPGRNVQEIRLKGLSRRASERLVRQVLGPDARTETVERIAAMADGNAFYLEELIRAVAERRPPGDALPETVLAMVQTRLEGLDPEHRRVLRAASILGEVFWPSAVGALLGGSLGSRPEAAWVDALLAEEVLVRRPESRFAGEPELAFRNGLLREGAYAMLTEGDRALGHRLAGEWLEQHGEGDPMVLAQHFERGGARARAGGFYLRAAEQALRGADPDAAIAGAEQALRCDLPAETRAACLGLLSEAHAWRYQWDEAAKYADELLASSPRGSSAWVKATSTKASQAFVAGKSREFIEALLSLQDQRFDAEDGGERPRLSPDTAGLVADALCTGVFVLCATGRFALAEGMLRRIDALVAPLADQEPVARGRMRMAHAYWDAWGTGDVWAALAHGEAAAQSFDEASDRRLAMFARVFVGNDAWALGDLARAERELRAVIAAGGEGSLAALFGAAYLAWVLIDAGALDEARAIAARRVEMGRTLPSGSAEVREAEGRWLLGEIALREGDLAAAEREIEGALGPLEATALQWAAASATLAEVRLAQGRAVEALALAAAAASILEEGFGFRGAYVRLVHAEALHAAGQRDAAVTALAAAHDALLARAMKIGDPEARRRFLERVPENARTLALARERLGAD